MVDQDAPSHRVRVRFLREAVASTRATASREAPVRRLPRARVLSCLDVDDPAVVHGYGYHSSHVYGFAYRKLKRRMAVLGLDVPPPDELMPGPIASPEEARAAGAPV